MKLNDLIMKYIYTFFVLVFGFNLNAQVINFPDASFKARLVTSNVNTGTVKNFAGNFFKLDVNNDGQIQVSEALLVKEMNVTGQNGSNMFSNMTGIEYFTNMTSLKCGLGNPITTLNVSGLPQLKILECIMLPITSLDLNNLVNLERLNYGGCTQLTNLVINSNNIINDLICDSNNLTSLNLSLYPNLRYLDCSYNQLTSLDLTSFTNFERLNCANNQLTSLNITGLNLKYLNCSFNNQLPLINFSLYPNLEYLDCSSNSLQTTVNLNCPNLNYLSCNNLQLTSLDVTNSPNIAFLLCSNNLLTTLELNHLTNLNMLSCSNNQLTTLFVKGFNNPWLGISDVYFDGNPNLHYICCNESQIDYFQYRINEYGYTNCFANTYCTFTPAGSYYVLEGNEKLDSNENGCDVLDISVPNLKFNINDTVINSTTISNLSGSYSLPLIAGNYTITPILENPNYFTIYPTSFNVQFPANPSPFVQDFCVSVNGVHPDLDILLYSNTGAIPGTDAKYTILYRNKGNQIQSGSIQLAFDDSVSDLVSTDTSTSNQSANLILWNFNNLQPFETRMIHFTINLNSPTETPSLNSGDVLHFETSIASVNDETPLDNTFALNQIVTNSYDPNDKTCLEGTTIAPSQVGKDIHYMIRFENTGTANAQNIVVKDIIDTTKFDISTLVPLNGSHPYVTKISNGSKVEFIFENIQLPFDDANNDGYVVFKIKTKPTLALGNTFSNTANIYFDYNFPIITNTYTTTVAALANQDFEFSYYFSLYPNPAKQTLNIQSKKDIEISSISIYNIIGQLVQVMTNAKDISSVDVSNLKTGTYLVKVNSDKGSSNAKFIKE